MNTGNIITTRNKAVLVRAVRHRPTCWLHYNFRLARLINIKVVVLWTVLYSEFKKKCFIYKNNLTLVSPVFRISQVLDAECCV